MTSPTRSCRPRSTPSMPRTEGVSGEDPAAQRPEPGPPRHAPAGGLRHDHARGGRRRRDRARTRPWLQRGSPPIEPRGRPHRPPRGARLRRRHHQPGRPDPHVVRAPRRPGRRRSPHRGGPHQRHRRARAMAAGLGHRAGRQLPGDRPGGARLPRRPGRPPWGRRGRGCDRRRRGASQRPRRCDGSRFKACRAWYRTTRGSTVTALLPRPGVDGVAAVVLSADTISPVAAALRLRDRLAFILESVEGGARYGRYSMVGVRGRMLSVEGDLATVRDRDYAVLDRFEERDPLEALRRLLPRAAAAADLPVSLASGVGYLAYEAAARWERLPIPDADPLGLPAALFHLPDVLVVFHHLAQTATLATIDDARADE